MSKKTSRRNFNPLSLAFLDVMSCGFGAVVLIFLILDHSTTVTATESDPNFTAEVNLLEIEVEQGELGLVQIRNTLSDVNFEVVTAEGLATQIQEELDDFLQELAALENTSMATVESVEQLQSDIKVLEEELMRLHASSMEHMGDNVRQFVGDGNRQYLSGLFLGGQRILILVDSSASMMDSTLVNIIRTRNMSDQARRNAPKWQRTVNTVDWVSSQLPITSRYQLWRFSDDVTPLIPGTEAQWLEVADREQLDDAVAALFEVVPDRGTNLENLFVRVANMDPPPDNIFLITDGLPTIGNGRNPDGLVSPARRLRLFEDALDELPNRIPVNVVLLPLEGDPSAAAAYWQLAQYTQGSFITPSKDWP